MEHWSQSWRRMNNVPGVPFCSSSSRRLLLSFQGRTDERKKKVAGYCWTKGRWWTFFQPAYLLQTRRALPTRPRMPTTRPRGEGLAKTDDIYDLKRLCLSKTGQMISHGDQQHLPHNSNLRKSQGTASPRKTRHRSSSGSSSIINIVYLYSSVCRYHFHVYISYTTI